MEFLTKKKKKKTRTKLPAKSAGDTTGEAWVLALQRAQNKAKLWYRFGERAPSFI
jgi:hypothetical protein